MEEYKCPFCQFEMTKWLWVRFTGTGIWEGNSLWSCPSCNRLKTGDFPKEVEMPPHTIAFIGQHRGSSIVRNEKKWLEDIGSRRVLPNGDVAIVNHKGDVKEVRKKGTRLRDLRD